MRVIGRSVYLHRYTRIYNCQRDKFSTYMVFMTGISRIRARVNAGICAGTAIPIQLYLPKVHRNLLYLHFFFLIYHKYMHT